MVTDTFDPILENITITFNGTVLTETTDYTYNKQTGAFVVNAGQITVPAAEFTQDTTGRLDGKSRRKHSRSIRHDPVDGYMLMGEDLKILASLTI